MYFSNIFVIVHKHVKISIFMYKEVILQAVNIFFMFILCKGHLLFLKKMIVMFATRKKDILRMLITFYLLCTFMRKDRNLMQKLTITAGAV